MKINTELGATTVASTDDAFIQEVARHLVLFCDGQISKAVTDQTRPAIAELQW